MKKASYYVKNQDDSTKCTLCPHVCVIRKDRTGFCGVRSNIDGDLFSLNYRLFSAISLDPIEKKPLARFHPGSKILSLGSVGCNLACPYCQNSDISKEFTFDICTTESTEEIIQKAQYARSSGNIGIAFTYNEPFVSFETVFEIADACHDAEMLNVLVTNGFVMPAPLTEILPLIDAMNIDLKAFNEIFYKDFVKGNLSDVLRTIEMSATKCHIEITTLIIPGMNDTYDDMRREAEYIASIDRNIPLHISRFFPRYKFGSAEPTPVKRINELRQIALEYLNFVYTGNM